MPSCRPAAFSETEMSQAGSVMPHHEPRLPGLRRIAESRRRIGAAQGLFRRPHQLLEQRRRFSCAPEFLERERAVVGLYRIHHRSGYWRTANGVGYTSAFLCCGDSYIFKLALRIFCTS